MRILYCLYDHPDNPWVGGGGAVRAERLLAILGRRHEVTRLCGAFPGCADRTTGNSRVVFAGYGGSYLLSTFSFALEGGRFVRRHASEFDVVVEDFAPWNPLFGYKIKGDVPVVLQVHHREGTNIIRKYLAAGLPFYLLESRYPQRYRHVITVSEESREKFGLTGAAVISNGIEEGLLHVPCGDGSYIAYLGRIDMYNKGVDLLLEAGIDKPVLMAGKGKDVEVLKKKIRALSNYRYLGFLRDGDKRDFLAASRCVVMPSRFEGQGIVALEAAALGRPLIVSDIPELKYVVDNGFGVSFATEDAADLRNKMAWLWSREETRAEMGRRGRAFAREYTWDKIADEYENYLVRLVDGCPSA